MADDKKISDLTAAGALSGVELVEIVQGGVNKQTTTQDIANLAGASGTSIPYGTTAGTNTITATMSPTVTAYTDGDLYSLKITNTTTGSSTLNLDGVGAKKIYDTPEKQISIGDFVAGRNYLVQYNSALDAAAGGFIVVGNLNHERLAYRGGFDASSNVFPATGGSGASGAIRTFDAFRITVAGTLGGVAVENRDFVIAVGDNPTDSINDWYIIPGHVSMALKANLTDVIGVQDLFIPASAMWPRVTGGCGVLTQYEMATSLFNVQGLPFDQTTQEFAQFQIRLPRKYNNGTITVAPYWTAQSGSGTVQWGISGGAYSNDDALTVALGTAQTSDDTLIATNDLHIGPTTAAITLAGTPADADFLAIQVSRNPASDTLTGDAILLGIVVFITTNAAIDA